MRGPGRGVGGGVGRLLVTSRGLGKERDSQSKIKQAKEGRQDPFLCRKEKAHL